MSRSNISKNINKALAVLFWLRQSPSAVKERIGTVRRNDSLSPIYSLSQTVQYYRSAVSCEIICALWQTLFSERYRGKTIS
jgi:hypothetical protein